jgi:hypothetical protein
VRTSAIFMSALLLLLTHPSCEDEPRGDEQHDQRDCPKRIPKPSPKPEKHRHQQQRDEDRKKVSEQVGQRALLGIIRR